MIVRRLTTEDLEYADQVVARFEGKRLHPLTRCFPEAVRWFMGESDHPVIGIYRDRAFGIRMPCVMLADLGDGWLNVVWCCEPLELELVKTLEILLRSDEARRADREDMEYLGALRVDDRHKWLTEMLEEGEARYQVRLAEAQEQERQYEARVCEMRHTPVQPEPGAV